MTLWAGGLGVTWEPDDDWVVFAGASQGFSPPSPRAAVKDGIEEETSLGMELGARYRDRERAFQASLTVFRTDFDDLIVINNIGGSGSGATENAGDVLSQGIELGASWDPGVQHDWSVDNPWFVAATWTRAELDGDSSSTDPESLFSGGKDGNDVPYVPDLTFTVGTGIEGDDAGLFVTATWVDETYSTASNTSRQLTPAGVPDARFGKTDTLFVVDLHAHVNLSANATLMAGIHNLFDREFIVSRHPHGPRPGRSRFAWVGLELLF
ncbi:MAG: TonB-dependent receptor domain-containing protein [Planctomycetota bacterium]|jgi:Fe(3+) dicitrate transport protein